MQKNKTGKTDHYYSEKQDSVLRFRKIEPKFFGRTFELWTGSGVFSVSKVDKGTEVLLNNCIMKDGWDVLDLGCGYGVIGIAVAFAFPKTRVVMTEVNKRAVKLARMNIKLNNAENAGVLQGDSFEKIGKDERFDTILFNPPQSAVRQLCIRMIKESGQHLKKGGLLQVVARHNKGGKVLSEAMEKTFGNFRDVAKKSGYRVYVSENKK
jgi:16S rRNA (guanine1207-N2)-methyltransferase